MNVCVYGGITLRIRFLQKYFQFYIIEGLERKNNVDFILVKNTVLRNFLISLFDIKLTY